MRILLILSIFIAFTACRKETNNRSRLTERTDFFKNNTDALSRVQRYLAVYAHGEVADSIVGISYIDSKNKSYAFVFYRSNKGEGNLVIMQEYLDEALVSSTSIKCDGEDCACKVKTLITDDGSVLLDCSCSSCTMLIH